MAAVAPVKTPFTPQELTVALSAAFTGEMATMPNHAMLAVLCAQVALETANGKSCICWNVGNLKAYGSVDTTRFQTTECVLRPLPDGTMQRIPVPMQQTFAAYPDLRTGCEAYLHLLWSRYDAAWSGVIAANLIQFVQGLHDRGYFTADPGTYLVGVARWQKFYLAILGGDSGATEPEMEAMAIAFANPDSSET